MKVVAKDEICDLTEVFKIDQSRIQHLFTVSGDRKKDVILSLGVNKALSESPATNLLKGVYPNPISSNVSFEFELKERKRVHIQLTDRTGKMIEHASTFNSGNNTYTFQNTSKLASGVLVYQISFGRETYSGKIIKL